MRRIVVINHVTLDGVMQAPARPDEDRRGGFEHGGWAARGTDEVMGRVMGERMAQGRGSLLLGRRTYEEFYAVWPKRADNPYTERLNQAEKYVASTTMTGPLPWANSTLLTGDVPRAVAKLKEQSGEDIAVLGSGTLIHSLMPHHLIDSFVLMIHPLVLGSGLRLFPDGAPLTPLRLTDSVTTTTGVMIATYERINDS